MQTTHVRDEQFGETKVSVMELRTGDDVPLCITRILPQQEPSRGPVVLIHGTYTKRNFWVSPKGIGLGPFLAEAGFDVWIPELRGHGLSPKTKRFRSFNTDSHIRQDLPAIQQAVEETTKQAAFWVGHSAGGLYIYAAMAAGDLRHDRILGLVTLGSQLEKGGEYLRFPPIAWGCSLLLRLLPNFPAPTFGLGPEVEPTGEILDYIRWKTRGTWSAADGTSYQDGLSSIQIPVLVFAGEADKEDPPSGCRSMMEALGSQDKTFVHLAKHEGFSQDYGHVELIVSKAAQQEVWPRISQWLLAHHPDNT